MSMTPERIEEIKSFISDFSKLPGHIALELLAALEESQQQNARWKEAVTGLMMADTDVQRDLAEAQQTIARQQERERSIIYEVSEIHKEAAAGNSGSLERADTALNRIMLLSSNLLALGNKEGSDKA